MKIIAERDKSFGIGLMVLGVLLTVLSVVVLSASFWDIVALVFGVAFTVYSVYKVFCLPKEAIIKDGNDLLILYAFHQKRIALTDIEYVSYNELGTFASRGGGWFNSYVLQNDIRRVIITTKKEGVLAHFYVWSIINATAVAVSINGMVEKAKRVESGEA